MVRNSEARGTWGQMNIVSQNLVQQVQKRVIPSGLANTAGFQEQLQQPSYTMILNVRITNPGLGLNVMQDILNQIRTEFVAAWRGEGSDSQNRGPDVFEMVLECSNLAAIIAMSAASCSWRRAMRRSLAGLGFSVTNVIKMNPF
ncbi:uncharacterized protein PG998_008696 [Apiospora kogelbergensis]|uniref:uncharacterized protein n=1 Tax=Apiospora kogelbergensis TaxID=1337665 RepID=UPI0031305281